MQKIFLFMIFDFHLRIFIFNYYLLQVLNYYLLRVFTAIIMPIPFI